MNPKEFHAKKASKNNKALIQQAREQTKEQRFDEAMAIYQDILKENPESAAAYMGIGGIHLRKGELDDAENYFNGALHVTKRVAPALTMLANVAQSRGDIPKALKLNQDAMAADPKFISAVLGTAKMLFQLERYEEARRTVTEALKYSPNLERAEILLARILQKMGLSSDAIGNLNEFLSREPKSSSAHLLQAQMYLQNKQFEAAIEAADKSLHLMPSHAPTHACLGQALIGAKQYIKAITVLNNALLSGHETWKAKMLLAKAYFLNGDLEEAKSQLSTIALGTRGLGLVYFMLGDISAARGLFSHALSEYEAGVLHSNELAKKFPQLQDLLNTQMEEIEKVTAFQQLLVKIREKDDVGSHEDMLA